MSDKAGFKKDDSVVAKVVNKIVTGNKNMFLEIENLTGKSFVFISRQNRRLFDTAKNLLVNDTVKIFGQSSLGLFFARNIVLMKFI